MTPTPGAARRARHRRRLERVGALLAAAGLAMTVETAWLLRGAGPLGLLRLVVGGLAADGLGLVVVGVRLLQACARAARADAQLLAAATAPAPAAHIDVEALRPYHVRLAAKEVR